MMLNADCLIGDRCISDKESAMPNHEDIERRAYELYEERGRAGGQDWDDWFRAEGELMAAELGAERLVKTVENASSSSRRRRNDRTTAVTA
jgi:hypothetical protein